MWILTIRSPWSEPREYLLQAGKTTLGRDRANDIFVDDDSASRLHAEIECDFATSTILLRDNNSTNGTFVNRQRVTEPQRLRADDQVRIGQHTLSLKYRSPAGTGLLPDMQPVTRDMVLEAIDQHALVLFEANQRLNNIIDLNIALTEVAQLARTALGADRCEVIPAYRFNQLAEIVFPPHIGQQAIEMRSVVYIRDASNSSYAEGLGTSQLRVRSVLCVPGLVEDEVVALVYATRSGRLARPFDQKDAQLAVAISHQAALSVQRSDLIDKARQLDQLATADEVTSLHSRNHFFTLAQEEFQRARRYHRPLSAMVIDINDFAALNANCGREVADQVLRAVANCSRESLREGHLLSRYGPDEFVVLLLECNLETARHVGRRLSQIIADQSFETAVGPMQVKVTTGTAALADDTPDLPTLVYQAETNLQGMKQRRDDVPEH